MSVSAGSKWHLPTVYCEFVYLFASEWTRFLCVYCIQRHFSCDSDLGIYKRQRESWSADYFDGFLFLLIDSLCNRMGEWAIFACVHLDIHKNEDKRKKNITTQHKNIAARPAPSDWSVFIAFELCCLQCEWYIAISKCDYCNCSLHKKLFCDHNIQWKRTRIEREKRRRVNWIRATWRVHGKIRFIFGVD